MVIMIGKLSPIAQDLMKTLTVANSIKRRRVVTQRSSRTPSCNKLTRLLWLPWMMSLQNRLLLITSIFLSLWRIEPLSVSLHAQIEINRFTTLWWISLKKTRHQGQRKRMKPSLMMESHMTLSLNILKLKLNTLQKRNNRLWKNKQLNSEQEVILS